MNLNHTITASSTIRLSSVVSAKEIDNKMGFSARQFRREAFDGLMEPLIMVDDYTMTEPTFGAHPHAGIAAISVLFEETEGLFYNHDSLDNHLALRAGDLYWLNAASGAMHEESPKSAESARIRGLQIFLKLPATTSIASPNANHIQAADIPLFRSDGIKVRVVSGTTNGVAGYQDNLAPATILDGRLAGGARFSHSLKADSAAWLYAVCGELVAGFGPNSPTLRAGNAIALNTSAESQNLSIQATQDSHFVLINTPLSSEKFVNHGPFALKDCQEIAQAQASAKAGLMGQVERKSITNL
ncbi:pirin family protein [Lacimicrobium alkaliphilum]|uniref:Pirin n=1 Tax=Lacimicrobium alkaliphilum TaxID=1526571 RepID=A0A0U3AYV9_9ALTE|nr:pirin family protein [Lacimicrobium alkaliphilum]ALS98080.1 hypothetical protein AT746_07255 [Lacimicrobium alkaliphilum]